MPRATLIIDGDTSALRRALGEIPGFTARAQSVMTAAARRGGRERVAIDRTFEREHESISQRLARARERAAKAAADKERAEARRVVQADAQFARERDRIHTQLARARERAARETTRMEAREARRQVQTEAAAARERDRIHAASLRERIRQERAAARERRQMERQSSAVMAAGGRAARALGGAAAGYATGMDAQIQGARADRADVEHTLNAALYQAGSVSPADAARLRQRVLARSRELGQRAPEVAQALLSAQSQFNVLAPEAGETREMALDRNMDTVALAANSYQSPQEMLRLSGVLGQQGIRGADRRATLMALTGMAQSGGVELSNLSSEALGPLMQNIARGTNAGMTAEQRSAAVRSIVAETVGIAEVASRGGLTALDSTRAVSKFRGNLSSGVAAERYYARLHAAGRDDVAQSILSTDAQGRHTFQAGLTPVELMSRVNAGFGGDAAAAVNVLRAGGGPGMAAMDSQQIRLFEILAAQTARGQTIGQSVGGIVEHGSDFTDARLAEGEALRRSEDQNTLNQNEADNTAALRDLHPDLVGVSDSINNWRMRNPWLAEGAAQGARAGSGVADALTSGAATGAAGGTVARMLGVGGGIATRVGGVLGSVGSGVLRAAIGAPAILGSLLTLGGSYGGVDQEEVQAQRRGGEEWERQSRALAARAQAENRPPPTAAEIGAAVAIALRAAPVTATVTPHDAAHAASAAAPAPRR